MKARTAVQTALFVAILTLLSKVLGLVKNQFMAGYFGTNYITDTLNISIAMPNMIFAGLLSATATSFIPVFSKTIEKEGECQANIFTSRALNLVIIISVVSSLVGILLSREVVTLFTMPDTAYPAGQGVLEKVLHFLTHGWTGERLELGSFYVKVTFSYCLFSSFAGILTSWLQYKKVFVAPVLAGYIVNFFTIAFILVAHRGGDPRLLVVGLFAGTAAHCVVIGFIAARKGFRYTFDWRMNEAVRRIFVLALPVFVGGTVWQINLFVDKLLASGLREGSIASLEFANLLIQMAPALTSGVIGTMLYPRLAQAHANEDRGRYSDILTTGLSVIVLLAVPFTLGALLYNGSLVHIVYARGAFGLESIELTSTAFFYYAVGLPPQMLTPFLVQAFYSLHDTKTPLYISFVMVAANITLSLLLVGPLAHGGLALGTSLAGFVCMVLMFVALLRRGKGAIQRGFLRKCLFTVIASCVAVGASMPVFWYGGLLFAARGWVLPRMVQLGVAALVAVGVYLLLLRLLRVEELKHIRTMLRMGGTAD
ncbi:MAG: murein biosynthesis integral membrane protein MurJ [Clostridiales Family XIII bacterium]|jgi:putative peptidoglycan lipid II flippase|nr:murein biosynthesis integral membrane protein MurJ [Clostridiales Family XIII bacterium]